MTTENRRLFVAALNQEHFRMRQSLVRVERDIMSGVTLVGILYFLSIQMVLGYDLAEMDRARTFSDTVSIIKV